MNSNKIKRRGGFLLAILLIITALTLPVMGVTRERPTLYVGGIPFGVRFFTDGVLVVGYCDVQSGGGAHNPAKDAGLRPGDCIYQINEEKIDSAANLAEAIEKNGTCPLTLSFRREGKERTARITPLPCDEDGRLRTGLYVRDSGAGIGTVTFVTEQNTFGGLGHGICDGESGTLIPMARGSVMGVTIAGMNKGAAGAPGELKGHFSAGKTGSLTQNTPCGVFGAFAERPSLPTGALPIAYRDEVHDGAVTLWCTLDDNVPREYNAEITAINRAAEGNKCFTVHITDKALLEKTGGIIQGMSGSPIIQDGHLVGAVTHVLIGDPTTGYGIFIENMLNQMGDLAE
ncbi:MAG: SpoIVB peptidase [Clostridia bacterium]|nr:SpoIVB peptidase [Clostridia bacterium]